VASDSRVVNASDDGARWAVVGSHDRGDNRVAYDHACTWRAIESGDGRRHDMAATFADGTVAASNDRRTVGEEF
jgi:hypothetical protein